jgi:SAM-dependent methyltransferase
VHGWPRPEFTERDAEEKFGVVTFFEVLEHQAEPAKFLEEVKACLRTCGYVALSVPNRERWLTGPDVLDYPPNHFLRWSAGSLRQFLGSRGFEVLSEKEQPAGIGHTAQVFNMSLRTGISRQVAGNDPATFREVMQMGPAEATEALSRVPSWSERALQFLGRIKHTACYPIAVAAYPYVRLRGYKGTYMYFLARLLE